MVCACLVCKIYGYYNKGVYVQLIRSTTKAATHSCMKSIYPKIKLHKNTRNHTNLIKRTSQLHERQSIDFACLVWTLPIAGKTSCISNCSFFYEECQKQQQTM